MKTVHKNISQKFAKYKVYPGHFDIKKDYVYVKIMATHDLIQM